MMSSRSRVFLDSEENILNEQNSFPGSKKTKEELIAEVTHLRKLQSVHRRNYESKQTQLIQLQKKLVTLEQIREETLKEIEIESKILNESYQDIRSDLTGVKNTNNTFQERIQQLKIQLEETKALQFSTSCKTINSSAISSPMKEGLVRHMKIGKDISKLSNSQKAILKKMDWIYLKLPRNNPDKPSNSEDDDEDDDDRFSSHTEVDPHLRNGYYDDDEDDEDDDDDDNDKNKTVVVIRSVSQPLLSSKSLSSSSLSSSTSNFIRDKKAMKERAKFLLECFEKTFYKNCETMKGLNEVIKQIIFFVNEKETLLESSRNELILITSPSSSTSTTSSTSSSKDSVSVFESFLSTSLLNITQMIKEDSLSNYVNNQIKNTNIINNSDYEKYKSNKKNNNNNIINNNQLVAHTGLLYSSLNEYQNDLKILKNTLEILALCFNNISKTKETMVQQLLDEYQRLKKNIENVTALITTEEKGEVL